MAFVSLVACYLENVSAGLIDALSLLPLKGNGNNRGGLKCAVLKCNGMVCGCAASKCNGMMCSCCAASKCKPISRAVVPLANVTAE